MEAVWNIHRSFSEASQIIDWFHSTVPVASHLLVLQGKMQTLRHGKERSWHESKLKDKLLLFHPVRKRVSGNWVLFM